MEFTFLLSSGNLIGAEAVDFAKFKSGSVMNFIQYHEPSLIDPVSLVRHFLSKLGIQKERVQCLLIAQVLNGYSLCHCFIKYSKFEIFQDLSG